MKYPYDTVHFNGRDVKIAGILNESATSSTAFESAAFSFIRSWCGDDEYFLQHTSGSTGLPKSISISRAAMVASAKLTQHALQLKAGEAALLCLDPNYIAGKMMIVRAFVTGLKLLAVDPSLNPFAKLQPHLPIDFAALIPSQLMEILRSDSRDKLNRIKNIIVGGAALSEETRQMLTEVRAQIFATYGMTETVSHIALQALNGKSASEYFKILPGVSVWTDDRGCLQIKTPFLEDEITTNDIVEIKNADEFKWVGRFDNVINTGGVKIIPEQLESQIQNVLTAMQVSNRFVASSVPDPIFGEKLVLLIEGKLSLPVDVVMSSLEEKLPRYHVPRQIVVNANIVTTENGKVNRPETRKKIKH